MFEFKEAQKKGRKEVFKELANTCYKFNYVY